jgi:hypothetical protein
MLRKLCTAGILSFPSFMENIQLLSTLTKILKTLYFMTNMLIDIARFVNLMLKFHGAQPKP